MTVTAANEHDDETLEDMSQAVVHVLEAGQETITDSDIARCGFTRRQIASLGEAAIVEGRRRFADRHGGLVVALDRPQDRGHLRRLHKITCAVCPFEALLQETEHEQARAAALEQGWVWDPARGWLCNDCRKPRAA